MPLIQAEMAVPAKSLPAFTGTTVPDGVYVISYVESSKLPAADDSQVDEIRGEALTSQSRADEASFYEGLKKLYKMEILKKEYEYQAPTVMK